MPRPVPPSPGRTVPLRRRAAFTMALALLLAAGLTVRWVLAVRNPFPSYDGVFYLEQARDLVATGHLPFSTFPPGWPLLFTPLLAALGLGDPAAPLRAAQALNVVLGVLLVWLSWLLLKPRLGFGLALTGAAVVAFLPQHIILARSDLSDLAYGCGLLGGWLLLERRRDLPAGLMLGYTYLVRPESALASLGLLAWRWRVGRRLPWRLALGHAVFVLPYLIFLKVAGGGWDVSSKTVALSQTLDAYPGAAYLGVIARNLGLLAPLLTGQLGLPLALLAAYGTVRHRGAWAWLLAPLLAVPLVINPMVVRFWLPYLPVLLLGAGLGLRSLVASSTARGGAAVGRRVRVPAALLAVAVIAGLAVAAIDDVPFIERNTEAYVGLKQAGLHLRSRVARDAVVASAKPYTSYWAWCEFAKIPDGDVLPDVLAAVERAGARYLVVDAKNTGHGRLALRPLLVPPLPPELAGRLSLVGRFTFPDAPVQDVAIFEVRANAR